VNLEHAVLKSNHQHLEVVWIDRAELDLLRVLESVIDINLVVFVLHELFKWIRNHARTGL
jgi:hypothetical protein